jgi:hypothetical protein
MRAVGQRGGLDKAVYAAGRVRRGAANRRRWGKRRCRRLESPACIALVGGGIVAPPATGAAQSTAAALLRCSGTDPPSETAARLCGGATAPHSSGHVEVDASEPPMGDGEFLTLRGDWGSEMTRYVNRRFGPAGWHCIPLHRWCRTILRLLPH